MIILVYQKLKIVQLQDAKAMLDLQEEAARRYKQYGIKPTYGINMLDRLKELNIKPTKQNILKYLKSLPDTDSIKKAALQFKNLDDYIKWLNTMPLADNGNINETENYNFA